MPPAAEEVQPDRNSCPAILTVEWIVLDSNYTRQTSNCLSVNRTVFFRAWLSVCAKLAAEGFKALRFAHLWAAGGITTFECLEFLFNRKWRWIVLCIQEAFQNFPEFRSKMTITPILTLKFAPDKQMKRTSDYSKLHSLLSVNCCSKSVLQWGVFSHWFSKQLFWQMTKWSQGKNNVIQFWWPKASRVLDRFQAVLKQFARRISVWTLLDPKSISTLKSLSEANEVCCSHWSCSSADLERIWVSGVKWKSF